MLFLHSPLSLRLPKGVIQIKYTIRSLILTLVTFISVFCCNGVYAFAATSSIVEQYNNLLENNKKLEIKYNDLKEDNDKLKEENERLNIMISQYKMMIDGLDEENRKIIELYSTNHRLL